MHVRPATEADSAVILDMSRRFYATTSYASITPMSDESVERIIVMLTEDGVMLVAEEDGVVIGMVGLAILPFTFNTDVKIAAEVVWWVEPDSQGAGAGKALLAAIEPACWERGVAAIQMMLLASSPPQAEMLYARAGYAPSERSFTKLRE